MRIKPQPQERLLHDAENTRNRSRRVDQGPILSGHEEFGRVFWKVGGQIPENNMASERRNVRQVRSGTRCSDCHRLRLSVTGAVNGAVWPPHWRRNARRVDAPLSGTRCATRVVFHRRGILQVFDNAAHRMRHTPNSGSAHDRQVPNTLQEPSAGSAMCSNMQGRIFHIASNGKIQA